MDILSHTKSHNRKITRVVVFVLLLTLAGGAASQQIPPEEIVIGFEVPRLLSQDIFVWYDGKAVYLPVTELFSILGFNVIASPTDEKISGYLWDKSARYIIDIQALRMEGPETAIDMLPSDYVWDGRELFLRMDLFHDLFDLKMIFDFSLLRVQMPLKEELPLYQKMKRKKARGKLKRKKESLRDVLTLARRKEYAEGGVIDWRFSANPVGGGGQYYDLTLGAMLMGGDLSASGGGSTEDPFDDRQLKYRWHYFLDNNKYFSQVDLGNIYTGGILGRGFTGASVTNKPQINRKYFQTINLSSSPGEGWEVELYVDGRLTDYVETDSRGTYEFNLDIFYGASSVVLKLYGPNGEVRTEEQHIRIPFNLIPKREFEYQVAVGEATGNQKGQGYGQASLAHGVFSNFTVGASVDIPFSPLAGEIPLYAVDATYQVATNLTASGSAAPGNRTDFNVIYSQPSLINASLGFTKFYENPVKNLMFQDYRAYLSLSAPIKIGQRYVNLRYYISRDQFADHLATNMNFGLNISARPVYLNYLGRYKHSQFDGRSQFKKPSTKELVSQIMASVGIYRWFRPQFRVEYDHSQKSLLRYGTYITKRLFRTGQVTLSMERNVAAKVNSVMLTFNFFTNFMEVVSRSQVNGDRWSVNQVHRGSLKFDQRNKRLMFQRRAGVGYGAAVVRPYLDRNYNGRRDRGEQTIPGLRANISGSSGRPVGKDRLYYYDRLRAYDEYLVQIDEYSLDDPTLKPSNDNYRVTLNPNVVTAIDVPIVTASEIEGKVQRQVAERTAGVGGIKIMIVNVSKDILSQITTFSDGEYFYLGLLPGYYRAYIDPKQLAQYGYVSEPESIEFEIDRVEGGASITDINFLLLPKTQPRVTE